MADPDLQIKGGGGGGHPDPEIRRGPASENLFSFWSKNKRGAPGPPSPSPGSATDSSY